MVGIVLVAHDRLAIELKNAVESIVGPLEGFAAVEVPPAASLDTIRTRIGSAIEAVHDAAGVLLMTDLFGGTPTNVSLSFLEPGKVEVLSGINLPMLMKASTAREGRALADLAKLLRDYGRRHIVAAGEVLVERAAEGGAA